MSATSQTIRISADNIPVRRRGQPTIALVGTPNGGKSTLFNRLTGLQQRVGNFPGVTVERHVGNLQVEQQRLELIDLPGLHSLSGFSQEERTTADVLFGRQSGQRAPDAVLAVVDATNLYQGLYLLQQLLELGLPLVVALTMSDAAERSRIAIDRDKLSKLLGGVAIHPVVATSGAGIAALRAALATVAEQEPVAFQPVWPELFEEARRLAGEEVGTLKLAAVARDLVDAAAAKPGTDPHQAPESVAASSAAVFNGSPALAQEARIRYGWVRNVLDEVQSPKSGQRGRRPGRARQRVFQSPGTRDPRTVSGHGDRFPGGFCLGHAAHGSDRRSHLKLKRLGAGCGR
ncbi:MAG: FeoB small GTPase domain-containing protein [Pseudomonadota bacterium]